MKCTNIKNARGKRAKVLLSIGHYAMICDVLVAVVVGMAGNDQIQDFAENSSAWQYFFLSFSLGQCRPQ